MSVRHAISASAGFALVIFVSGQAPAQTLQEMQRQCANQWREAKEANATNGQTWPRFWNACRLRLSGQTAETPKTAHAPAPPAATAKPADAPEKIPKAAAKSEDRRIRVNNLTSKHIITALYGSPVDQPDWTYNMIRGKSDWIRPGQTKTANIDDGTGYCRYDLLLRVENGAEIKKFNVNVCEITDWDIHD